MPDRAASPAMTRHRLLFLVIWTALLGLLLAVNVIQHGNIEPRPEERTVSGPMGLEGPHDIVMTGSFALVWLVGGILGICAMGRIAEELDRRQRVIEDLTRLQERFDGVASSVREWFWEVDPEGRYTYISGQTREILGYDPAEMLGHVCEEFMTPEARQQVLPGLKERMAAHAPINALVCPHRHKSGRAVILEATGVPVLDRQTGQYLGYRGAARDITGQVRSDLVLRKSLDEKVVLLREVHHRVKNNMQVISSFLALQAHALGDPALDRAMDASIRRIRTMALAHEGLYQSEDFSRVPIAEYLGELVRGYAGKGPVVRAEVGQDVALELDYAIPVGIIAGELLANAVGHSGGSEVCLRLSGGEGYRLEVTDDGRGIPPGQRPGLGLTIVGLLVEQIEGRWAVRNTGHGTLAWVEFSRGGGAL